MSSTAVFASTAAQYAVGQRDYHFDDTSRHRPFTAHVWYPVDPSTPMSRVGRPGPFLPVMAAMNAPMAKGPAQGFPVVLLSHGSGGLANKLFWFAQVLVRHGIVVVGVDHPHNMVGDNTADGLMRVWDRARDLSFALDRLLETPEFKSKLDLSKVGAAGHSAGGATALLLGGARLSASRLTTPIPECAKTKDPYYLKLCDGVKALKMSDYPKQEVEGDYRDPRVKAVVAFDPGFARSFDVASLKKMTGKTFVFLAQRLASPADEIHSKDFLKLFPPEKIEVVPGSVHMTFLQGCKPGVSDREPELKELCVGGAQRLGIQKRVADKGLAFFEKRWKLP